MDAQQRHKCLQLLKSCKCLPAAQAIHTQLQDCFRTDAVMANTLLQAYGRSGDVILARSVFNTLSDRNIYSWVSMLAVYATNGHLEQAKQIDDAMPVWNMVAWSAMLTAYAQNGHLAQAREIFLQMKERNLVSWTAMLSAFINKGRLEEAKELFRKVPELDLVLMTVMVTAYAQIGHEDNCWLSEARGVFLAMPERDLVAWTTMLTAYSKCGQLVDAERLYQSRNGHFVQAKHLFDLMHERDEVSWTSMLSAYAHDGKPDWARKLFDTMEDVNSISYSAIMAAYAHNARPTEVLDLFYEMSMMSLKQDGVSLVCVLVACKQSGKASVGKSLFDSMSYDFELKPNRQHYCCMVDLLGRAGYVAEAEDLILHMPYLPSSLEWTSLLGACIKHEDAQRGSLATKRALRSGTLRGATYVLFSTLKRHN